MPRMLPLTCLLTYLLTYYLPPPRRRCSCCLRRAGSLLPLSGLVERMGYAREACTAAEGRGGRGEIAGLLETNRRCAAWTLENIALSLRVQWVGHQLLVHQGHAA